MSEQEKPPDRNYWVWLAVGLLSVSCINASIEIGKLRSELNEARLDAEQKQAVCLESTLKLSKELLRNQEADGEFREEFERFLDAQGGQGGKR